MGKEKSNIILIEKPRKWIYWLVAGVCFLFTVIAGTSNLSETARQVATHAGAILTALFATLPVLPSEVKSVIRLIFALLLKILKIIVHKKKNNDRDNDPNWTHG